MADAKPLTFDDLAAGAAYTPREGTAYDFGDGIVRTLRRSTPGLMAKALTLREEVETHNEGAETAASMRFLDSELALLVTAPKDGAADPPVDTLDMGVAARVVADFFGYATRTLPKELVSSLA